MVTFYHILANLANAGQLHFLPKPHNHEIWLWLIGPGVSGSSDGGVAPTGLQGCLLGSERRYREIPDCPAQPPVEDLLQKLIVCEMERRWTSRNCCKRWSVWKV